MKLSGEIICQSLLLFTPFSQPPHSALYNVESTGGITYLKSQIGEIGVNQPEEQHQGEIGEKEELFGLFCIFHEGRYLLCSDHQSLCVLCFQQPLGQELIVVEGLIKEELEESEEGVQREMYQKMNTEVTISQDVILR